MGITTLLYCLILTVYDHALVEASAMSSMREEAAPLLLYNPGHDLEGFDYGAKRDVETDSEERTRRKQHPGASYIRVGRSHGEGPGLEQSYPNEENLLGARPGRGRSDEIIRFGRSSQKRQYPNLVNENKAGYLRPGRSGSSKWARFGRSATSGKPTEAEMAILCPNILVAEDPRGSEDLQMYLAKLVYICNNNNNNNNNGNVDGIEENSHNRNNLEFLELNGDAV